MKQYTYKLKTLSSLIVSPRANLAFYPESKEEIERIEKRKGEYLENIPKVIYPFYRYGEYDEYDPDHAQYYLPGSSIKGALQLEASVKREIMDEAVKRKLMVDDIPVPRDAIDLRNIYKAQYLQGGKQACFKAFFENVGVEMVKGGITFEGKLYYLDDAKQLKALLTTANDLTQEKIKQMRAYLQELIDQNSKTTEKAENGQDKEKGTLVDALEDASDALSQLKSRFESQSDEEKSYILLLGGYKGLLHSLAPRAKMPESKGGVFLDPETHLPHGLVEINLE